MRKAFVLMIVLLIVGLLPATAQEDDRNPFMQMLARIPDTAAAREWLTYIDYRAVIAARPGAPAVTTWQEFESASRDETGGQLMSALIGIQSGPAYFARSLMQGGEMAEAVGFDPFMVERAAEFGLPPGAGVILEGSFDREAIIDAHAARGYTENSAGDLTLLCSADGCDNGMNINIRDRNPANPFGGDLGRSQPVLVGDQLVVSSPSIEVLDQSADTINGDADSLASDPDYSAAAEAISSEGTVTQAYFINPGAIQPLSEALLGSVSDPAAVKARRAALAQSFVPMPPYDLIAIGETATETEQVALLALVYADQVDAEAAAALFPAHIMEFESFAVGRTFGDLLTTRGVTSVEATIYAARSGRSVMLLTLRAPLPAAETPDGESPQPASQVYGLLVQAFFRRDLGWLATEF